MITGAYTILECPDRCAPEVLGSLLHRNGRSEASGAAVLGPPQHDPAIQFSESEDTGPPPSCSSSKPSSAILDHADRRIRLHIRAKERQIELLEERKRALIHEAVTGQDRCPNRPALSSLQGLWCGMARTGAGTLGEASLENAPPRSRPAVEYRRRDAAVVAARSRSSGLLRALFPAPTGKDAGRLQAACCRAARRQSPAGQQRARVLFGCQWSRQPRLLCVR